MFHRIKETYLNGTSFAALLISLLLIGTGYGVYKGVIDNFLAEIVHIGEFDWGVVEFFRELPGLIIILVFAVLYQLSAESFYKLGSV